MNLTFLDRCMFLLVGALMLGAIFPAFIGHAFEHLADGVTVPGLYALGTSIFTAFVGGNSLKLAFCGG